MVKAQRPQVIYSQNVISMSMRVEHRIQASYVFADRLLTEVGCSVDEHSLPAIFDQNRRPSTPITWIRRMADRTIAANCGHAHGRAAAQHRQHGFHRFEGFVPVACGGRASALVTSTYAMRSS